MSGGGCGCSGSGREVCDVRTGGATKDGLRAKGCCCPPALGVVKELPDTCFCDRGDERTLPRRGPAPPPG